MSNTIDFNKIAKEMADKAALEEDDNAEEHTPIIGERGLFGAEFLLKQIEDLPEGATIKDAEAIFEQAVPCQMGEADREMIRANLKVKIKGATKGMLATIESDVKAQMLNEIRATRMDYRDKLKVNRYSEIISNEANVLVAAHECPELNGVFAYDEFLVDTVVTRAPPWTDTHSEPYPRHVDDEDITMFTAWLQKEGMSGIASNKVAKCIQTIGRANRTNVVKDWMDRLEWDGIKRLDTWTSHYLGAKDTSYVRAVSSRWMISAVARVYVPGCKVDTMLILEGPQGVGKSSVWDALVGSEFFIEYQDTVAHKDIYQVMHGKWIFEFSELSTFNKKTSADVKAFLTKTADKYRAPYDHKPAEHKRQNVFCGSVNEDTYLMDSTGARRFWSVRVGRISLDWLRRDREQLWAEAVHRYKAGERWWLDHIEDVELIQHAAVEAEERFEVDAWEESIKQYLTHTGTASSGIYNAVERRPEVLQDVTVSDILCFALDIEVGRHTTADQRRVGAILRRLEYRPTTFRRNNIPTRGFTVRFGR